MIINRRNLAKIAPISLLTSCANIPNFPQTRNVSPKSRALIYENSLSNEDAVRDFRLEGRAITSFHNNRMLLQNRDDPSLGQASNFVFWCNVKFPSDVEISWEFRPIKEPGLCVAFFNANGHNNLDLFDAKLKPRTGEYEQYTKSDISALQIAFFRRRWPEERAFHLCNLRQAPGFKLLATSADPIPNTEDVAAPFLIKISRFKNNVRFSINDLPLIEHELIDHQNLTGGGYFGFRQMAPLIAEYANLKAYSLV